MAERVKVDRTKEGKGNVEALYGADSYAGKLQAIAAKSPNNRVNFGSLKEVIPISDLIEIQTKSYADFLQADVRPDERLDQGLQAAFKDIFPAQTTAAPDGHPQLEFVRYRLTPPTTSEVICLKAGETYQAGLEATFRVRTANGKDIKEETIPLGEIPLMTDRGSFIINGAERVIVSQLHRSPGVSFEMMRHASGKKLYSFRIISDHGSWIEVQFDVNDYMYIYLDRKRRRRKFLVSTFLRAFGYDGNRDILDAVHGVQELSVKELLKRETITSCYTAEPVMDPANPEEELFPELEPLSEEQVESLRDAGVKKIAFVDVSDSGEYFVRCLQKDPVKLAEEAQKEIYKKMRPQDNASAANAKALFHRMFEDPHKYNLGLVGRFKMNQRLGINVDSRVCVLTRDDIAASTRMLMRLRNGKGTVDDIDHLGRRRVRTVGELIQKQCLVGLTRIASHLREKQDSGSIGDDVSISKMVSPKALSSVIRDFFSRNQLSQFMDQTNCLAELTNKRRLSALGPGGLTRERAGLEVRDVHSSHYGRVCPIETPEGPNIGLISSLALYAKLNEYGFIMTPYRKVVNGVVTDQVVYLTADEEENYYIAQANAVLDKQNHFQNEYVLCRYRGETGEFQREFVNYMDVSPKQLISAAAGLIPFLEHDDANRALMGSNMQRQAVPLLRCQRPLIGTGLEGEVACGSRAATVAREDGIVAAVDATRIIVTPDGKMPEETAEPAKVQRYDLFKFMRTNASTFFNQRPIVHSGQAVRKGQAIADGASTDGGELALGRNVLVAFMPWHGYNYEDAIIISERLVANDTYSSVHITLEEVQARDTKLGKEEITRDIPNEGEEALRNLDTEGVIRIGAEVKPGDILVGKITPKNEPDLAPEERLLKAIFGEKSSEVKNSSLVVPGGTNGIVMEVRVQRDEEQVKSSGKSASKKDKQNKIKEVETKYRAERAGIIDEMVSKMSEEFLQKKLSFSVTRMVAGEPEVIISADRKITKSMLTRLAESYDAYEFDPPTDPKGDAKADACRAKLDEILSSNRSRLQGVEQRKQEDLKKAENELQGQGKPQRVWVYIASKRRISIGDKMAGRHGNKGIVSKIVPVEDMPFMADGTPVDIILNPLGVPSRMNIGQVLETHAGYAADILGVTCATPVFDGIPEEKIWEMLGEAKKIKVAERGWTLDEATGKVTDQYGNDRTECFVDTDGKTRLYDGVTGEPFAQRVMVGQIYMLKLDHLVANKIHARAVGPYSLVTQQPLGGKAQHGGQRFGEMEVWALEAYGAAYTLQEMLTVKSDDVAGRTKIYESIMSGDETLNAGIPESFNVLMKEMQSLCLDVRVRRENGSQA